MTKISNKMFEYKAHYVTKNVDNCFHLMQVLLGNGLRKVNI
jgi:hypothetical protein